MALDSRPRRGRPPKRRRMDMDSPEPVQVEEGTATCSTLRKPEQGAGPEPSSSSARLTSGTRSDDRLPANPFQTGANEAWVVRDGSGNKRLTSAMVPGCRHWRIGDPNICYCFVCKGEQDLVGCHTCKRSYHIGCLAEHELAQTNSRDTFYCPPCIERGWNIQPPPELLPLTPNSSRGISPVAAENLQRLCTGGQPQIEEVASQAQKLNQSVCGRQGTMSRGEPVETNMTLAPASIQGAEVMTAETRIPEADSRAAAFLKTYNLVPPAALTSTRPAPALPEKPAAAVRGHRPKSRYQTMPDEVDQALTIIYRELESVTALKQDIAPLRAQVKNAEQTRKMLEGQLALHRSGHDDIVRKDVELDSLRRQLLELRTAYDLVQQENISLKSRLESDESTTKAGAEEIQTLKANLRRLLGE